MLETAITSVKGLPINNDGDENMPSLNHSYVCLQLMRQLIAHERFEPLPELTLDIGNGLTPDISVFPKIHIKPDAFHDISRFCERPLLAIGVISSSQTIQEMLQKASLLVAEGVSAVWTVEPYSRTVFVTTAQGETLFHEEPVESEGVKIDFSKVFPQTGKS
jgi:Uma2 family endonuclease